MPALYRCREHVDDGELVRRCRSSRMLRQGAYYVDQIVERAAPSDLPVEFPIKLELVINLCDLSLTIAS